MKFLQIDSNESSGSLTPVIAAAIITVIIIVVYNAIKYLTMDVPEDIPYNAVHLTSASVVISGHPDSNNANIIEKRNVCVLSKSKYISNDKAINLALGENKKRYTAQNYDINVIRPCSKQTDGYANQAALTLLKA